MKARRGLFRMLGMGVGVAALSVALAVGVWAEDSRAEDARSEAPAATTTASVPLERRTWPAAPTAFPPTPSARSFVRTGLRAPLEERWLPVRSEAQPLGGRPGTGPTGHGTPREGGRTVSHAKSASDRFHLTAIRFWLYRDFLPKSVDSDVLGVELNSAWGWGRFDFTNISYIELADYARAVPGRPAGNPVPEFGAATGVTDLLTAFLVSPKREHHSPHHFAGGFAMQFPTASDGTLGSGKWAIGPAVDYEYHNGRFFAGFVALQLWSFAGDADRKNVNMMMIKPMVTYDLGRRWKAVYMPYGISVYWDKPGGEKVYLPLGAGLQYSFRLGRQQMAASLQFFKYVLRPSKGSEYDLRLMLELDF